MSKGAMPAIALLLGKAKPSGKASEADAPESSDGEAREYFDAFASAMRDEDDDAAFEALQGLIRCCNEDD